MKLTEKRFENPDLEAESIQFLQIQAFKIIEDFKKENKHFGNLSDPQIISRIGVHNFFSNIVMKAASSVNEFNKRLVKAEREGDKNRIDIYKNALDNANIMFEVLTNEPFENIKKIYKGQIDSPNLDVVKVGDRSIRYVIKSQTDFLKAFTRSLRPFGIKISLDKVNLTQEFNEEETSINEGIEEGINEVERWQRAYIEINPNDTLSQLVKRKLATIKKRVIHANKPDTFKINSLGAYEFYSLGEVFNFLGKNITDSYTEKEMLEKIESLVDTKPFMKDVLELAKFNASFRAQLRITLASKTFQEYSIIYERDGEYKIISANKTSLENVMINNVIGDFLIEDSKFFEKFKDGPRKGQVDF